MVHGVLGSVNAHATHYKHKQGDTDRLEATTSHMQDVQEPGSPERVPVDRGEEGVGGSEGVRQKAQDVSKVRLQERARTRNERNLRCRKLGRACPTTCRSRTAV